jgi:hypothetical protein
MVSFRTESGVAEGESWTVVDSAVLSNTVPWRTFRWYKGQRHYSGLYWSATMRDHVVYESRLELARLIGEAGLDGAAGVSVTDINPPREAHLAIGADPSEVPADLDRRQRMRRK